MPEPTLVKLDHLVQDPDNSSASPHGILASPEAGGLSEGDGLDEDSGEEPSVSRTGTCVIRVICVTGSRISERLRHAHLGPGPICVIAVGSLRHHPSQDASLSSPNRGRNAMTQ